MTAEAGWGQAMTRNQFIVVGGEAVSSARSSRLQRRQRSGAGAGERGVGTWTWAGADSGTVGPVIW